jgi:hypothetical protein
VGLHEIVDREVILTIIQACTAANDLLELIMEWIGRIRTMLRMLRASTPVESFCDVVRTVGMLFSLYWKSRKCWSPSAPSAGYRAAHAPRCGRV